MLLVEHLHRSVLGLVHIWNLLRQRLNENKLHRGASVQQPLVLDELTEKSNIRPDLRSKYREYKSETEINNTLRSTYSRTVWPNNFMPIKTTRVMRNFTHLTRRTCSKACRSDIAPCFIRYAMHSDAERLTPATQCTSDRPPACRTCSIISATSSK